VPITRDLNLSTWVPWDRRRVFTPGWSDAIDAAAARQVTPLRENRNLVGYYLDNELDWSDAGSGPSRYFERLAVEAAKKWTFTPTDAPEQRVMLVKFAFRRSGTTASFSSLR
jgi:hypothetical protein